MLLSKAWIGKDTWLNYKGSLSGYSLYEQFQDSFVFGVHIIFFVPIGCPMCTVSECERQAGSCWPICAFLFLS